MIIEKDFILSFKKILETLNLNTNLLKIINNKIAAPIGDIVPLLTNHKSNLPNQLIDFNKLKKLAILLSDSIIRLNHIGFCYKTNSQSQEKSNLIALTSKTKCHLYQEPSSDDGLWLFFGEADKLNQPMLEFLPVEKVTQWIKWKEYWLPSIHIDIDTDLNAKKTVSLVKEIFGKNFEPHLVIVNGITFIVRCRLGIIDGVNIFLDLATNARNVKFQRKNIWKQLV